MISIINSFLVYDIQFYVDLNTTSGYFILYMLNTFIDLMFYVCQLRFFVTNNSIEGNDHNVQLSCSYITVYETICLWNKLNNSSYRPCVAFKSKEQQVTIRTLLSLIFCHKHRGPHARWICLVGLSWTTWGYSKMCRGQCVFSLWTPI